MIYLRLGPTFFGEKGFKVRNVVYSYFNIVAVGNPVRHGDTVNLLINLPNLDLAHPYRNKIAETNVYVQSFGFENREIMHQAIPAMPIPLGNSGAFSHIVHPRGQALAVHPITPGHLTISLYSPYSIVASFNDQFIGKYSKFLLNRSR